MSSQLVSCFPLLSWSKSVWKKLLGLCQRKGSHIDLVQLGALPSEFLFPTSRPIGFQVSVNVHHFPFNVTWQSDFSYFLCFPLSHPQVIMQHSWGWPASLLLQREAAASPPSSSLISSAAQLEQQGPITWLMSDPIPLRTVFNLKGQLACLPVSHVNLRCLFAMLSQICTLFVFCLFSLSASLTVISVKAVSGMITFSLMDKMQLTYPIFYIMFIIMIASCVFQVK